MKNATNSLTFQYLKFEEKVGSDRLRSKEAKEEDIQFYLDQKEARIMYIAAELDLDFDIAVKNEQARHSKMEEFKAKEKEMGDLCRSDINELEV